MFTVESSTSATFVLPVYIMIYIYIFIIYLYIYIYISAIHPSSWSFLNQLLQLCKLGHHQLWFGGSLGSLGQTFANQRTFWFTIVEAIYTMYIYVYIYIYVLYIYIHTPYISLYCPSALHPSNSTKSKKRLQNYTPQWINIDPASCRGWKTSFH